MPAPLDQRTKERAARLVGLGLTQAEAAGAIGISTTTVERLLRLTEFKQIAEDERRRRESPAAEVARIVRDMLESTDPRTKERAAELYMRHKDVIDAHDQRLDAEDELLPGCYSVIVFPAPDEMLGPNPDRTAREQAIARHEEDERQRAREQMHRAGVEPDTREPEDGDGLVVQPAPAPSTRAPSDSHPREPDGHTGVVSSRVQTPPSGSPSPDDIRAEIRRKAKEDA